MPWLLEMSLVVSALMAPAVLYLSYRLYSITNQQHNKCGILKVVLPIVLISFYLFPIASIIDFSITNDIDVLSYPKFSIYWFWFGLVFVFQLVTWIIIADMFKLVSRLFSGDKNQIVRIYPQAVLFLFVVIFCFTGWKVYHDTTQIETQQITLPIEDLPQSLHNFKIVHITDIQGDRYTGTKEIARYIQKVNEQDPDLVIFTGDLISYGTDYIQQSAEAFGNVKSQFGTFAIVGDHDYWAGVEHVETALNQEGITLLQDENQSIKTDGTPILVTGVTEVYSKAANPQVVDSLTKNTKKAGLKIFASHQIDKYLIQSAQQNGYSLMLAGHTHGGQIQVPFMGMNFSASERETKYVSGLYQEGELPINVNNGLGFTLAPIRYDAPPNISVITLVKNTMSNRPGMPE